MMVSVRVFLVDDSPAFLSAAASFLTAQPGIEVVGRASLAASVVERVSARKPDVALVDLGSPGLIGLAVVVRLKALAKPPRVVILSDNDEPPYRALVEAVHADGFVLKRDFGVAVMPLLEGLRPSKIPRSRVGAPFG